MKSWILIGVATLLLLMLWFRRSREGFEEPDEDTSIAGAPTGGSEPATTTGGSTTSAMGSNSGGGGNRRKQVFGPLFMGMGEGGGADPIEDSSRGNVYPELLGGGAPKSSTRIDGVGIVTPTPTGGLPSSAGLGSDEASQYFPTSRVPGDMEKIPDPYRVSQTFSAANYSFKTDPVPFLTDFSAFQR